MATPSDSAFTQSVNALVTKINDATQAKESLFEQAEIYFQSSQSQARTITQLTQDVEEKRRTIDSALNEIQKNQFREFHNKAQKALNDERSKQSRLRYARLASLNQICTEIIQLCEGTSWQETQQKSARVLATLLLTCPTEGKMVAQTHQRCKPFYKAVLSLRLLDQMLRNEQVENPYVVSRFNEASRFSKPAKAPQNLNLFQKDVAIPLISASMLQDIGMQHPEIQRLLKGSDGSQDPYRVLEKEVRIPLLIMNHEQTIDYANNGLGEGQYSEENDDSAQFKERKERFDKSETNRARLLLSMLNGAIKPKEAVGSALKAAQIYTSIVLSTKPNFNFADLPKATKVVLHSAQKGALTLTSAQSLQQVVGNFPMGFGVVFCHEKISDKAEKNYAYALVNMLNPPKANDPHCRIINSLSPEYPAGKQTVIPQQQNLYFEDAFNQFSALPEKHLDTLAQNIAEKLAQPRGKDTLPNHWSAYAYFHFKKQQNFWLQHKK